MLINNHSIEDVTVVAPEGRCDRRTAPALAEGLEAAARSGADRIIVDMGGVTFMDSTGLATLIRFMKQSRAAGGDLYLANLQQPVRIIFELTRLDSAFTICPTVDAAVDTFAIARAASGS
jgi:anti-sigma B factor antagonist